MPDDIVVKLEKKSSLFDPIFKVLPYPLASAVVRGIRALITIIISALIVSVTDGSLIKDIHFISADQAPIFIAIVSPILLAFDKWLREKGLENEVKDLPTSVVVSGPTETDTLAEPPTDIPLT